MKLRLTQEQDVAVLDVLEDVSMQNVTVLRAGITKFLQSGKNKIVLNLVDATQIAMEVVREIVKLHMVATELKGDIVLVGHGDMVKQAIRSFATPPPIKYFATKEAAIASLRDIPSAPEPIPVFDGPNAELKTQIAKLEQENKILKGKLANRNIEELRRLRFENGIFQQQVTAMEEQLRMLTKERKKPFEMESMQVKILQLETALTDFLEKESLLPQKP